MRIMFPEYIEDKNRNVANIAEAEIVRTVNSPLQKQRLQFDDLTILLFLSQDSISRKFLLILGDYSDNEYHVKQCLRLRPELIEKAANNEPLVLLRQLTDNFGLNLRFGQKKAKFFFRDTIRITNSKQTHFSVYRQEKTFFYAGAYFKEFSGFIKVAIAFSLNLNSYKNWLKEERDVEITPKVYDVFISYKRNTAKDYALHLKQCLTEEGYVAFLDLKDIRKEFLGTTKWFDERDQAIRNSKRFLLIITIRVDSSKEVAKELTLARSVPNMKFIYFRHDVLEPQIILKTDNNEIIDLSEGNQEMFCNEDDLARKVFQILQESKD